MMIGVNHPRSNVRRRKVIGTLLELFWACVKIGCLAFGGGNAAIPLLEAEAVPRWVSPQEFGALVGLNFAFPGLSILKLAGMVGLRAAGTPGLLVAVIGLAAPGLVLSIAAYSLLMHYRDHSLVCRSLVAMQYAAAALLVSSALRMVQAAAGGQWHGVGVALTLGLFFIAHFLHLGPVLVVVLAAAVGMLIL
jgi:chromate transporter